MRQRAPYRSNRIIPTLVAYLVFAAPVLAAPRGDSPATSPGQPASQPAAFANAAKAGAASPAADSPAAIRSELEQLKAAVQAESQQFAEHSKELDSERAALSEQLQLLAALEAKLGVADSSPVASAAAPQPAQAQAIVATPSQRNPQVQTPQDLSNRIGNLEQRVKAFGPFTFSGDIRLREEPFFGGPSNGSLDQNRERFRLRFRVDAKLNDDFTGGFSLASGDINNPTSTNQNITGFYARKPIAIDTAFVQYSPHQFHNLTLEAGKFAYPWFNTELVWDKDLNPEGAAETLGFNLRSPVLKRLAFVGFELPFSQVAGVSATSDKSLSENVVYGGQLQTQWEIAPHVHFGAFTGYYDYSDADPIALALQTALSKNPQTPLTGVLPLASGSTVANSIVTTTATNVVTVGGTAVPTGVAKITNAQFLSKFGLFDSLATFDVDTPWERWPIRLIGDYVQNTEACGNVLNLQPAPKNTSTIQYSQSTNFACDSRQRRAYWGEFQVGRAKQRGDWQFDYTWMCIEREAVMSAFVYSEIYQGSDVTEHRVEILYQAHRNVQLGFTGLIGRPLNFGSSAPPQNWLERLQFDLLYSF